MWVGSLAASLKMPTLPVPPHHEKDHQKIQQHRAYKKNKERKRLRAAKQRSHKSLNNHHTHRVMENNESTARAQRKVAADLKRRVQQYHHEEQSLSNSVDERLLVLAKVLPAEYLQGELTKAFLQKNSIAVLNKIADRILNGIRRDAWRIWSASTIEKREREIQEKLRKFSQQGGMRRLKRMFAKAMHERTERMFEIWTRAALVLRSIEQTPCAIRLESVARMFLVRNWLYHANASAKVFQQLWRQHAARKIIRALAEHRLRCRVALRIQNRWRSRCAWREVQKIRMVQLRRRMSSMQSGAVGDFSAVSRMGRRKSILGGQRNENQAGDGSNDVEIEMYKNSFMTNLEQEAEDLMALAMTGQISVEEVKERLQNINQRLDEYKVKAATASVIIQRSWLGYVARCQVLIHRRNVAAATCIEAGYRGYCGRRYASATAAVARAAIEATRHAASFAITHRWRTYRERQMQQAALVAITEAVKEAQRAVACMTIQDAFRERQLIRMLEDMEREMAAALEFAAMNVQRIVRGHFGRMYAAQCRIENNAASKIQQMYRCRRARQLGQRIVMSADKLTRWARQRLYQIRLNILRRKVLHRWGRRRHAILRRIMSAWPGWADVGARRLKVIKWGAARRHAKISAKKKSWRALVTFIKIQRHTKALYVKAFQWWRKSQLAKGFRTYKDNVAEIVDMRRKLLNAIAWWNKRQMIRGYLQWKLYYEWRLFRKQQYIDAAARLVVLREKRVIREFRKAVEDRRMQLIRAAQWFFSTKERQSWIQWKTYLKHRQEHHERMALATAHAQETRPYYREMTGVKRWVRWVMAQKEKRARMQRAMDLWKRRRQGAAFRSWQLLVRLQKADRKAETFFRNKYSTEAVNEWHEWAVDKKMWRRKLAVLSKKAAKHFRGRKWAPAFLQWKAVWQKANAERIERERVAAALINRAGRGYMARRLASAKRRINELMRPLKIAREEAVQYKDAMGIAAMRNSRHWVQGQGWLAIMYYSEFLMDGDEQPAQMYRIMTAAFAGAAIDMLNNWPVVVSVKANAMSSYESPPPYFPGTTWSRGSSLMLGPSEKLPQELPVLRLWWQGNPAMHNCQPLTFTADFHAMVEKSKTVPPEPNIPGIGQRPTLEKIVLDWYLATVKHVTETVLHPTAARDIQRVYRSKVARRRIGGLRRAVRLVKAARTLQSAWNYWAAQKLAKKTIKSMAALKLRAVRLVQNAYRGFQSRDFVNIVKEMIYCQPENYPRSLVCAECTEKVARQACVDCDMPFCDRCFLNLHDGHHGMAFHFSIQINYKAMDSMSFMCGNCEVRPAVSYCTDCEDAFCVACKEEEHSKGARALHTHFIHVDATPPGTFLIESNEISNIAPELDLPSLETQKEFLMNATRTVTGVDPNWKTTKQMLWERSDEAKRLAEEALEKRRIAELLEEHREQVQTIFKAFDLDNNGTIDQDEMIMVFRKVICAPLSKSEIKKMYKELDKDGDGQIDFDEFHEWYVMNIIDTNLFSNRTLTKAQLKMQRSMDRMKTSMKKWVDEQMPVKIHPKVPGYDALTIRDNETKEIYMTDVARVKPKFWWWARVQYGLDKDLGPTADEQRAFTQNELEAFDMLFKRQWNTGVLPVKFYHDGRRFYKKGIFWRQRWDRDEEHFTFTNEDTGYQTLINPDPSSAELAQRAAEKARERSKNAAKGFQEGVKNAGRMVLHGAGAVGKGLLTGAGYAGQNLMKVGASYEVRTLMNLGYSRKLATMAVERAPNLAAPEKPSAATMERQLREARTLQIERDEFVAARKARLRDEPNLGMVVAGQMAKFGRSLRDMLKGRKKIILTVEEKKASQLAALRRDLYGDDGMPDEHIDLESSDDEDYWA